MTIRQIGHMCRVQLQFNSSSNQAFGHPIFIQQGITVTLIDIYVGYIRLSSQEFHLQDLWPFTWRCVDQVLQATRHPGQRQAPQQLGHVLFHHLDFLPSEKVRLLASGKEVPQQSCHKSHKLRLTEMKGEAWKISWQGKSKVLFKNVKRWRSAPSL